MLLGNRNDKNANRSFHDILEKNWRNMNAIEYTVMPLNSHVGHWIIKDEFLQPRAYPRGK